MPVRLLRHNCKTMYYNGVLFQRSFLIEMFQIVRTYIIVRIDKNDILSFRFIQPLVAGRTDTCIRLMQHTDAAVSFGPVMAYLAAVVRTAVID